MTCGESYRVAVEVVEKRDAVAVENLGTLEQERVDNVEDVVERQRLEDPPLPLVHDLKALLRIARVLVEALYEIVVGGVRILLCVSSRKKENIQITNLVYFILIALNSRDLKKIREAHTRPNKTYIR